MELVTITAGELVIEGSSSNVEECFFEELAQFAIEPESFKKDIYLAFDQSTQAELLELLDLNGSVIHLKPTDLELLVNEMEHYPNYVPMPFIELLDNLVEGVELLPTDVFLFY